jgi:hypothetical protein
MRAFPIADFRFPISAEQVGVFLVLAQPLTEHQALVLKSAIGNRQSEMP